MVFSERLIPAAVALLTVLCPLTLSASPLLEWNGASTGPATFGGRVLTSGAGSTYFNPAMLLEEGAQTTAGFFLLSQRLYIDPMARPNEADIDASIYDARRLEEDGSNSRLEHRPLATDAIPRTRQSSAPGGAYA
ncbi:MAG: hypothetical protein ACNA8W_07410, partial [Bradymonadaceae bacterium]